MRGLRVKGQIEGYKPQIGTVANAARYESAQFLGATLPRLAHDRTRATKSRTNRSGSA